MMFSRSLISTALAAALAVTAAGSLAAGPAAPAMPAVQADKNLIRAHLSFLADDLLEGRETGSRGYDIAANYVASQFVQYGIAPKGDNGSFQQAVTFRTSRLVPESAAMEISGKNGKEALAFLQDFSMSGSLLEAQSEITAPLVFVGYGVQATRFNHDDYANIDVKGKIVVMLTGRPLDFPTEEGAHFGSNDHKRAMAEKHGAVGMITLQTPQGERVFPFAKIKEYVALPKMGWVDKDGKAAHEVATLQNGAYLSLAGAQKLFAQAGVKLDDIYAAAAAKKPVPRMDLQVTAHLAKKSTLGEVKSSNVVGLVEGSDAKLKNEYVVFTAHLDHLGVVKEKAGDNLYNGAMDNASGVATMLETARLVSQQKVKPKRSMLFIALTGEEKGLLGSDFFANNPTVPVKDIVANVNLDMPMLTYDFSSVTAFGADHSSLKATTAAAAKTLNLALAPDPWPEQGLFTRSDHYNFVRQGVPSIFLVTGHSSFNKNEDAAKAWGEFFAKHYHQPSDDLNQPMNWDAAARFAQVNYSIGMQIANDKARPSWNKGDFFGDLFRKN